MSDKSILIDILNTLHRLETCLENQESRLATIELSIRSGPTSFTPEGSFVRHAARSLAKDKLLPELPGSLTPPPSSQAESPVSMYEASILKLRGRFEFIDDSRSDVHGSAAESSRDHVESKEGVLSPLDADSPNGQGSSTLWKQSVEDGASYVDNDDAYTQSVYSSRPLSRFDQHIPPMLAAPYVAQPQQGSQDHYGTFTTRAAVLDEDNSSFITTPVGQTQNKAPPARLMSRSQSWKTWGNGRRDSLKSSCSSQRSHDRVEIAYYAYDNFVNSLRSSRSFRSKERRAVRDEIRRLEGLSSPVAKHGAASVSILPEQRKGQWASMLRSFYFRLFSKERHQRPVRFFL